eukprot:569345-Pleurochrysis_carterae.AAC.1
MKTLGVAIASFSRVNRATSGSRVQRLSCTHECTTRNYVTALRLRTPPIVQCNVHSIFARKQLHAAIKQTLPQALRPAASTPKKLPVAWFARAVSGPRTSGKRVWETSGASGESAARRAQAGNYLEGTRQPP